MKNQTLRIKTEVVNEVSLTEVLPKEATIENISIIDGRKWTQHGRSHSLVITYSGYSDSYAGPLKPCRSGFGLVSHTIGISDYQKVPPTMVLPKSILPYIKLKKLRISIPCSGISEIYFRVCIDFRSWKKAVGRPMWTIDIDERHFPYFDRSDALEVAKILGGHIKKHYVVD